MTLEELNALKAQLEAQLLVAQSNFIAATMLVNDLQQQLLVAQSAANAASVEVTDLKSKIAVVDSQIAALDTTPPTTPGRPTGVSTVIGVIRIGWAGSMDDSAPLTYRVYRDGGTIPFTTVTVTAYTDTGLAPSSKHTYSVDAVDAKGNISAKSPVSAEIVVLAEPPIPPQTELTMLLGCNQGSIPGCASATQAVRLYAGAPFQAASSGLGTGSNWGDHVGKRTIAITFNDKTLTGLAGRINTFLNSVPKAQMQGKLRLYITNVHEPERGDKGNTAAACREWTKQTILAIRAWRTAHPDCPNVWCNPNYMTWFERDALSAATSTRDWWPKDVDLSDVVLGVDPYDPTASREITYLMAETVRLWRLDGGKRYFLNEVNTKRTGTNGRDWWNRTFTYLDADGCEGVLLFLHASAGKDAPWTIDAMSAAAWDAGIKARPL